MDVYYNVKLNFDYDCIGHMLHVGVGYHEDPQQQLTQLLLLVLQTVMIGH